MLAVMIPVLLTPQLLISPLDLPGIFDPGDNTRIVTESTTGAELRITGEGDCASIMIEVKAPVEEGKEIVIEYDISDMCTVSNVRGKEIKEAIAPIVSTQYAPKEHNASATSCNYIHSSQTVQDVVNIDIAKHRFATRRCWNGAVTWMTSGSANSYTGVPWNHANKPTLTRLDRTPSSTVVGRSSGTFHTDWLWCNATSRWQAIELRNTHTSQFNGAHWVSFWQSRACPGTHMATASKTSSSSTW